MGLVIAMFPHAHITSVGCSTDVPCTVYLDPHYRLTLLCWWRLLDARSIVLTSNDDVAATTDMFEPDVIGKLRDAICGHQITSVRIADITSDLTLTIGPWTLQALSDSTEHSAWQLFRGEDLIMEALGGGGLYVF